MGCDSSGSRKQSGLCSWVAAPWSECSTPACTPQVIVGEPRYQPQEPSYQPQPALLIQSPPSIQLQTVQYAQPYVPQAYNVGLVTASPISYSGFTSNLPGANYDFGSISWTSIGTPVPVAQAVQQAITVPGLMSYQPQPPILFAGSPIFIPGSPISVPCQSSASIRTREVRRNGRVCQRSCLRLVCVRSCLDSCADAAHM
jgi:hypothetical protein